jgi:hypothetical protein
MRQVEASLGISEHSAAAAFAVYQTISFLGLTKSKHLSSLLIAIWTVLFANYMLRALPGKTWLCWLGVFSGLCLLIGSLEQRDLGIAFSLIWLLWLAVTLINRRVVKESVHS